MSVLLTACIDFNKLFSFFFLVFLDHNFFFDKNSDHYIHINLCILKKILSLSFFFLFFLGKKNIICLNHKNIKKEISGIVTQEMLQSKLIARQLIGGVLAIGSGWLPN